MLEEVTGTQLGDTVAYARVSGPCSLKKRVLTFGDVGSCVVSATVERSGYTAWNSGNIAITVAPGTLKGLGWTPAVTGTVGVDLVLDEVTGTQLGDTVAYARVSGPCSLKKRVLTFGDAGSCVVSATVERAGYTAWESGDVTITVGPGTIKGLGWTPAVTGTVGEDLVLDEVTGTRQGDVITYARVSGPCSLKKRVLTFGDVGSCVVSATVERSGYTTWNSGNIAITVAPGTLTGLGWTPSVTGTVGEDLVLDEVTGTQQGDVITYARVSGPCSLRKRVLTFGDAGSCVVQATVERSGYTTWESGNVTITVAPGTLAGLGWTPAVSGTVGVGLVLDEVTGTQLGDTVAYARVSGPCSLKKRVLTFGDVGSCVVSATVERAGYTAWNSGNIAITVGPGTIKGLGWTPAVTGTVGENLVLDEVTGVQNGDVITYARVSGPCSLNKRTLTFGDAGSCVVGATVERSGYTTWNSGNITITVAPGTLTGLGWTPSVTGTVGEDLALEEVTGTRQGDVITYARVSGPCSLNKRTLTFGDAGSCVVQATVERSGYTTWNSGNITITVAPGTLKGLGWTPSVTGTVGVDLVLDEVTGTRQGDVITYARVSGPCSLNKRTLTFGDVGSCVVSATVERSGYTTWESGERTITVESNFDGFHWCQKLK